MGLFVVTQIWAEVPDTELRSFMEEVRRALPDVVVPPGVVIRGDYPAGAKNFAVHASAVVEAESTEDAVAAAFPPELLKLDEGAPFWRRGKYLSIHELPADF